MNRVQDINGGNGNLVAPPDTPPPPMPHLSAKETKFRELETPIGASIRRKIRRGSGEMELRRRRESRISTGPMGE